MFRAVAVKERVWPAVSLPFIVIGLSITRSGATRGVGVGVEVIPGGVVGVKVGLAEQAPPVQLPVGPRFVSLVNKPSAVLTYRSYFESGESPIKVKLVSVVVPLSVQGLVIPEHALIRVRALVN